MTTGLIAVLAALSLPPVPRDTVPLYTDLGTLEVPITTSAPLAQRYFDQGMRLTYAFNHPEAIRSFEAALAQDPTCAMCWWGVAFALGPNINAPMDSASRHGGVAGGAGGRAAGTQRDAPRAGLHPCTPGALQRPAGLAARRARYRLRGGDARRGAGVSGRSRRRDAGRRRAHEPEPLVLLDAERRAAPGHAGHPGDARGGHRAASESPGRLPSLHPCGGGGGAREGGALRRAARGADARRRAPGAHAGAHLHPGRAVRRRRPGQPARRARGRDLHPGPAPHRHLRDGVLPAQLSLPRLRGHDVGAAGHRARVGAAALRQGVRGHRARRPVHAVHDPLLHPVARHLRAVDGGARAAVAAGRPPGGARAGALRARRGVRRQGTDCGGGAGAGDG